MVVHRKYAPEVYAFVDAGTKLGLNAKKLSSMVGMSPGTIRQARHASNTKWRDSRRVKRYKADNFEIPEIAGIVKNKMIELNIKIAPLARKAHVGREAIKQFLNGSATIRVSSLLRILKVLGLKFHVDEAKD